MTAKQKVPKGLKLIAISKAPPLPSMSADISPRIVDPPIAIPISESAVGLGVVFKRQLLKRVSGFLQQSFELYRGRCECGAHYDNNCAHFLTDAMCRAGLPRPFASADEKCSAGRLIRAKECLAWVRSFSTGFSSTHQTLKSGYWFVYQENAGQGHVCLHLERQDDYIWRGTTDLSNWPVNWHYFY